MSERTRVESTEPHSPSHTDQRRQRIALIAGIVLLAAGAIYAALAIAVRVDSIFFPGNSVALPGPLARVPGLDAKPAESSALTDRINILVLGLDRRPHHAVDADGPPRADSIHILSIDPVTKTGGVLAIPRDLYVDMPNPQGRGAPWQTRVNTAYSNGIAYKYPGGGPALARETVEQLLKIKINYYVVLDWVAFADVIDALGGIEVVVPAPLNGVEAFNVRDFNAYPINIAAGRQPMDSITALAYSRYRGDAAADLGRISRQHQVMQAVMEKGLALGWLSSAPTLWNKYRGAIDTDISPARLPGLVALARQVGPDRLLLVSLAGEQGEAVRNVITPYGEDVLVPVWSKVAPIVQSVIYDRRLREEGAQVKVVSGVAVRGQASRVASFLARSGFPPADTLGADSETVERRQETVIVDYTGKEYTVRRLTEALNLSRSAVQRSVAARAPGDPDIVVIVGQDLKLPVDSPLTSFDAR